MLSGTFDVLSRRALATAVVLACAGTSSFAQSDLFRGLGVLAGDTSGSMGNGQCMSADGSTVVGWSSRFSPTVRSLAVRNTPVGIVSLGVLSGTTSSVGLACSSDSLTVVGFCTGGAATKAFRFAGGVMSDIGLPPVAGANRSIPQAVSFDGSVTAGVVFSGAIRRGWRLIGSTYTVINAPAGGTYLDVRGMSGDGTAIIGETDQAGAPVGFVWAAGTTTLLPTPPTATGAAARSASLTGQTIAGTARIGGNDRAVVWRSGVPSLLPAINPTDLICRANAVSADGSIIGGDSGGVNAGENRACIWTVDGAVYAVADLLSIRGVMMNDWTLYSVNSVTPDGRFVSGLGMRTLPDGTRRQEIWVARLPGLCPADWNGDGSINQADLFAFVADWELNRADFNLDGGCDGYDLESFSNAWVNQRCR